MLKKNQKFAKFTSNFTFKRTFTQENCEEQLMFLLNTFLAEKLKYPIKGVTIMNSELLGKTKDKRGSMFDVYCEDTSGTRFIVEVQVEPQKHFIRRTFFYLCMAIANLAKKGKDYDFNLPKLYSISILDFDLDFGKNCTEVVQDLSIRNDKHPEASYDMIKMTFILLSRFKKTEAECKTIMDKVLFTLKNGHKLKDIPKNFTEKELLKMYEFAKISNFSKREFAKYEASMMNEYDYRATIAYAEERGIAKGETKGLLRAAKSMLADGLDPARVARITKLPKKKVLALR